MTTKMILGALTAMTLLSAAPAPAQDRGGQDRSGMGRWDWSGGRPDARDLRLAGRGVPALHPELRRTNRGRAFVLRNFDDNRDGYISLREAAAANRAFAEVAGPARDRFDWDARDRGVVVEERRVVEERGAGRWDRGAMRGYNFRQSTRGATMRLDEDVLFATDSAVLRPGATAKLEALAGYLRSEAGVRVAIDGYTDARGSNAHNQALSEHRAEAVRGAFDQMGVTRARFSVTGHGEADPVASNATPQGMRQNRRVEVTLLGQRADRF